LEIVGMHLLSAVYRATQFNTSEGIMWWCCYS